MGRVRPLLNTTCITMKNKENNTDLNHKYDVQNSSASAFLNYLMVLTQFNTEQKELSNPILIKKDSVSISSKNTISLELDDIDTESVYLLKMTN